jgi:hypothetical protein
MFIRSEKKSLRVEGKFLTKGASVEIAADKAKAYQPLIDAGLLSLSDRDPNAKAKAEPAPEAPKKRAPKRKRKPKPVDEAAETDVTNGE